MKRSLSLFLAAIVLAAAACSDRAGLTEPSRTMPPGPSFDIGFTMGDFLTGHSVTGTHGSLTLKAPAVSAGDVLIAQVVVSKDFASNFLICPPAGWMSILRNDFQLKTVQETFYHVAAGSQAADTEHVWSFRSGSSCATGSLRTSDTGASGGIIRYTGVDPLNPIAASGSRVATGSATTATAPDVETTVNGARVLRYFGAVLKSLTFNTETNRVYTVGNTNNSAERTAGAYHAHQATAGATGTFGAAMSTSAEWVAQTIALRPAGRIKVDKVTVPSGSTVKFDFTIDRVNGTETVEVAEFELADPDPPFDTGFTLAAGTYTIVEDGTLGWDVTALTCVDDQNADVTTSVDLESGTVTLTLASGKTVTCTFTNTQRAELLVEKVTDPAGSEVEFDFNLSGGPEDEDEDFTLQDGDDPARFLVRPGDYTVRELLDDLPADWDLTSIVCLDGEEDEVGTPNLEEGEVDLSLGAGATVTCTFTNTEASDPGPSDPILLYLHNNPTPPIGNTNRQANLPMSTTAPTQTTLYNYSANSDSRPGRLVQKDAGLQGQTDLTKFQNWRMAVSGGLELEGDVELVLFAGMKNFDTGKRGKITAFLRDCPVGAAHGSTACTLIATGSYSQSPWHTSTTRRFLELGITFAGVDHTVADGRVLEVKIVVSDRSPGPSDDDMEIAYDTESFPARLILP